MIIIRIVAYPVKSCCALVEIMRYFYINLIEKEPL